jgi:hypothetical protein
MRLSWKILFFIDALAHSPISAHSLISDSKRHHNSLLKIFFCDRRLSPLAHLGQFSYFSYDGKMMRKDVSGGWEVKVQKIRKNDEKRCFRRSKVKVQKIRKNDDKRRFTRSKVKVQKIHFLLNALKNEENKGNNAMFWMFLVKCDEKWRKCKEIMQFFNVSCWMR